MIVKIFFNFYIITDTSMKNKFFILLQFIRHFFQTTLPSETFWKLKNDIFINYLKWKGKWPSLKLFTRNNDNNAIILKIYYHSNKVTVICCEFCSFKFNSMQNLENHIKKIHGRRDYCCEECGIIIKSKKHFTRHRKIHTNSERSFICSICSKSFTRNSHLIRHMTVHSSIKLHECELCKKKFSRKDILNKHFKIHAVSFISN